MPGVGLYLGVVQFFFAASWIVYVLYLPQLAAQAGIGKAAVAWILMADQLVFVFADYASGVAADRVVARGRPDRRMWYWRRRWSPAPPFSPCRSSPPALRRRSFSRSP